MDRRAFLTGLALTPLMKLQSTSSIPSMTVEGVTIELDYLYDGGDHVSVLDLYRFVRDEAKNMQE